MRNLQGIPSSYRVITFLRTTYTSLHLLAPAKGMCCGFIKTCSVNHCCLESSAGQQVPTGLKRFPFLKSKNYHESNNEREDTSQLVRWSDSECDHLGLWQRSVKDHLVILMWAEQRTAALCRTANALGAGSKGEAPEGRLCVCAWRPGVPSSAASRAEPQDHSAGPRRACTCTLTL